MRSVIGRSERSRWVAPRKTDVHASRMFRERSRFVPAVTCDPAHAGPALHFAFHRKKLVLREGAVLDLPPESLGLSVERALYLGRLGEVECHAVELRASEELETAA